MATAHVVPANDQEHLISVEEYLRTSYSPDCDYVDGRVEERNVGESDHSALQAILIQFFMNHAKEWKLKVKPECRYQVRPNRFRVPDVAILSADQKVDRIIREAPLLCIEILSPEDTWRRIETRIADYQAAGVKDIWVFDPEEPGVYRYDDKVRFKVTAPELTVEGTAIRIVLADLFQAFEEQK